MRRSYFRSTPYYLAADRSHNYYILRDSATKRDTLVDNGADFNPGITIPNGGWNAPLDDVAAFMLFLVDAAPDALTRERYRFVLSRQSLEEMWRPVFPLQIRTAMRGKVGLTFYVDDSSEPPLVGHGGSQAGFVAYMYVNPANRSGILTAANTTNFVSSTRMGPVIDQGRALLR
jgi:CubicO group peptidase (beta-lactamase class C family)